MIRGRSGERIRVAAIKIDQGIDDDFRAVPVRIGFDHRAKLYARPDLPTDHTRVVQQRLAADEQARFTQRRSMCEFCFHAMRQRPSVSLVPILSVNHPPRK